MKQFIYKCRFGWLWSYLCLLTYELLLTNPWILLGEEMAANAPIDTHSAPASAVLHLSAFSVLGTLAGFAFNEEPEKNRIRYSLWLVTYAGVSEVLQSFVPNRWPSGEDILFNVMGLIIGAVIYAQLVRLHKSSEPLSPSAILA